MGHFPVCWLRAFALASGTALTQIGDMIEIEDIKDEASLEKWLIEWPKENRLGEKTARAVSVNIAYRVVMRVLPFWWQWCLTKYAGKIDLTALPVLRSDITLGVVGKMPTPEVMKAAANAVDAASSNAGEAAGYADPAADAVAYASSDAGEIAADGYYNPSFSSATAASSTASSTAHAAFATNIAAASDSFWNSLRSDCDVISQGGDLFSVPLWLNGKNPLEDVWQDVVSNATGPEWAFWIKWYEDALQGRPQNWQMLEQIALIESEIWEAGAEAVAKRIGEIELEYNKKAPAKSSARVIQKAVAMNLPAIPPQIDALIATIEDEIERLRGKNPEDDIEKDEVDRLRKTFEAMRGALVGLSEKLPSDGKPSIEDAEAMEGLLALYGNEFRIWPRNNAADIVDSSCRLVLIGLSAGVMTAFGAPALAATAVAGIAWGGKKLVGVGKALKDVAAPGD